MLRVADYGAYIMNHEKTGKKIFSFETADTGRDKIRAAVEEMILSSSGWRKIFAETSESTGSSIDEYDRIIMAGAAFVFHSYISEKAGRKNVCLVVGLDSRPTGGALGDAAIRPLLTLGAEVRFLGICAAPEIMAYVKKSREIDGFLYISASHNPVGYNGIKFGPGNGAVLGGKDSLSLISEFRALMDDKDSCGRLSALLENAPEEAVKKVYRETALWKKKSYETYLDFNLQISGAALREKDEGKKNHQAAISPGIVGDLNGSARCTSIDGDYLKAIGAKPLFINAKAGDIAHAILPEGENLRWCKDELEKAYSKDSSFMLGYMPDNDGDRGNLVYADESDGKVKQLKAQEVFALACLAELEYMKESGILEKQKCAVAVNGPTSCRIEKIASGYGVTVFRAEVGEANVVNLAEKLADDGWYVRYLGEGSNGGCIILPATVRDPLNTIGSITRLLRMRGVSSVAPVIRELPLFTTTETDDPAAKMKIKTKDHGLLKERYEAIFLREWESKRNFLEKVAGISSWEEINYMQTDAVPGMGASVRGSRKTGGLKILFRGKDGKEKGFVWMRGSGTEPVFRVMADIEGDDSRMERFLIGWQREMIEEADRG